MSLTREQVKILLQTATTVEEADEVINKNFDFQSTQEKIAFLKGMFDIEIIGYEGKIDEMTYFAMLKTVMSI